MRGTTRNLNESTDSDSIASICSVALMLDRTAPIPEPTRPATSRPVTSGPISTKNASACTVGIHAVAPNVTRVPRVCSVRTAPSAKPDATIRGRDFDPTSASCRRISATSKGRRNASVTARSPKRLMSPDCQHVVEHVQLRARSMATASRRRARGTTEPARAARSVWFGPVAVRRRTDRDRHPGRSRACRCHPR